MAVERVRFDRGRPSVLERVTAAQQRLHARLMELERARGPLPGKAPVLEPGDR